MPVQPTPPSLLRGRSPWLWALAAVAGATLLRAFMALRVPLVPDETYYWEWSRRLAFGYFDHPPLVAYLIAAGTAVLGESVLGVRVGALLAGGIASLAVAVLARRLGGDRAGLRAAVLTACIPLAAAGLLLSTPDAPLLLCAALTLVAVDRALASEPGSHPDTVWWIAAGLAAGLGFMAKYTAVLIPLGVTVALLARPCLRRRLRTPGPWLAALTAAIIFLPVLQWNAEHQWISFAFQIDHGLGQSQGGSALDYQLELLGGQLALVSPILFVLMAGAVLAALRDPEPRRSVLAVTATVIFGFFVFGALRKPVEANWPALAYVPGIVVLATATLGPHTLRWFRWGVGVAAVLVGGIYLQGLVPWMPVPPDDDPLGQAYGWDELAEAVDDARTGLQSRGCPRVWLGARTYQDASATAFHADHQPFILSTNLMSRPNQYDLWPGFAQLARRGDCLVLFGTEPGTAESARLLTPSFRTVEQRPPVERMRDGRTVRRYNIWVMEGWNGDPAPFRRGVVSGL